MDITTLRNDLLHLSCHRGQEAGTHAGMRIHADLQPVFESIPEDRLIAFAYRKIRNPEMRYEAAKQIRNHFPDPEVKSAFAEAVFTGLDWAITENYQGKYYRDHFDAYFNSTSIDAPVFQENVRLICKFIGATAAPAVEFLDGGNAISDFHNEISDNQDNQEVQA